MAESTSSGPRLDTPTERALYRDCEHYKAERDRLAQAARVVVDTWYGDHGGRTEQSEAVAPAIKALRGTLDGVR